MGELALLILTVMAAVALLTTLALSAATHRVLSRRPTETETKRMLRLSGEAASKEEGWADVFWVLLHSSEFVVIR